VNVFYSVENMYECFVYIILWNLLFFNIFCIFFLWLLEMHVTNSFTAQRQCLSIKILIMYDVVRKGDPSASLAAH
jgi:hypothetical protein